MILVWITWQYMRLTRQLAETTAAQFQMAREQQVESMRERRNQLHPLIENIRATIAQFPNETAATEDIRKVALWRSSEPAEIHRLSVAFGPAPADLAAEGMRHLAVLHQLAQDVQNVPVTEGYRWNRFPHDQSSPALQGAERCLQSLKARLERERLEQPIFG